MDGSHQTREQLVYAFQKNSREEIRAFLSTWQGHDLIDLRVFARRSDGEWTPTRKGLTLSRDLVAELGQAVAALARALDQAGQE